MKKLFILFFLPILIFFILLEGFSFLYWSLFLEGKISRSELNIFDPSVNNGKIISNASHVIPVKKNFSTTWSTGEFNVEINTDANGLRRHGKQPLKWEEVNLAFVGDSFTFGHGAEEGERFSDVCSVCMSNDIETNALNFSYINGWQPEHYEFFLNSNPQISPDILVMAVYLGNDFYSDILETKYDLKENKLSLPFRKIHKDGYLVWSPEVYRFGLGHLRQYSAFVKLFLLYANRNVNRKYLFKEQVLPNYPNSLAVEKGQVTKEYKRAYGAIQRVHESLMEKHGRLVVLLIPQNFYFGAQLPHIHEDLKDEIPGIIQGPNLKDKLFSMLQSDGILVVDPTEVLTPSKYFSLDGHWNPEGHRVVGSYLCQFLLKTFL